MSTDSALIIAITREVQVQEAASVSRRKSCVTGTYIISRVKSRELDSSDVRMHSENPASNDAQHPTRVTFNQW